VIFIIKDVKMW